MPNVLEGDTKGHGRRIAIAVARFNEEITRPLLDGALHTLQQAGVADADIVVAWVPGAFELPLCCRWFASSGRFDAVVALGAVVRGDTDHYDYVCQAATDGTLQATLATDVPIAFGVLTCAEWDQALARAGGHAGNKGADAAMAALAMANLRPKIAADADARKPAAGR